MEFLGKRKASLSSAQSVIKSCMYLQVASLLTMCFSELIHCNRSATIDFANTFIFIHDILMCFFSFGSYLVWIENGWLSTEHASTLDVIHINYTFNPMTLWKVSSSLIWRMQPRLTFLFIYLFLSLFLVCCPITHSWKVALLVYN